MFSTKVFTVSVGIWPPYNGLWVGLVNNTQITLYLGLSAGKNPANVLEYCLRHSLSWYGSRLPSRNFGSITCRDVPVLPTIFCGIPLRILLVPSSVQAVKAFLRESATSFSVFSLKISTSQQMAVFMLKKLSTVPLNTLNLLRTISFTVGAK